MELKGSKQQIEGMPFLRIGYTLLMISWSCMGFFLKYAWSKKIRFLNLGDQENIKRKAELTSYVSN